MLKTLFNFDISVLLYIIVGLILNIQYSAINIIGSFVGITSVGNSNWYIFAILVMYIISYIAAGVFKANYFKQAITVSVGTVVYYVLMLFAGMPSRFISTIGCYALGVWLCLYKNKTIEFFKNRRELSIFVLGIIILVTYKFRYSDCIMNISSIAFVLVVVWFNTFYKLESKVLYFIGQHAFSIFILQRIPMLIFKKYKLFLNQPHLFVIVCLIITVFMSIGFDWFVGLVDKKVFT